MIVVDVVQEMLAVFLALFLWRYLQSKVSPDGTTHKALAYVLH